MDTLGIAPLQGEMQMVDLNRLEQEADEMLDAMESENASPEEVKVEQGQPTEASDDTQAIKEPLSDSEPKQDNTIENEKPQERDPLEVAEERVANAQKRMTQATQEAADLRKQVQSLTQTVEELKQQPAQQPDNAINSQEGNALEKLDSLASEFEDFAPLVNAIRSIQNQVVSLQQSAEKTEQQVQQDQAKQAESEYMNAITAVHPDAETIALSPDFDAWLVSKPSFFRQNVFGTGQPNSAGTPEQVNFVLSQYKQSIAPSQQTSKLEEAKKLATPSVRSKTETIKPKPTFTREQINNMSLAEYEANEAAIDEWLYANG